MNDYYTYPSVNPDFLEKIRVQIEEKSEYKTFGEMLGIKET